MSCSIKTEWPDSGRDKTKSICNEERSKMRRHRTWFLAAVVLSGLVIVGAAMQTVKMSAASVVLADGDGGVGDGAGDGRPMPPPI